MKELKEEVLEMKKEVKKIDNENKSWALSVLEDYKRTNKRMFIIWIITFIAFIGVTGYCIYLLNDIGVVEDTFTQEIDNVDIIQNSDIRNGGN